MCDFGNGIYLAALNHHDLHMPVGTLSDVGFSQSILRYPRNLPPISALLPVKAVTDTAAL
ncbi:hypothetical protein A2U01_0054090, partial [Trifolium medium]|nr:hypothetical protein [Trifolium medium]